MGLDILIAKRYSSTEDYAFSLYFEGNEYAGEGKTAKRYKIYQENTGMPVIPLYSFLAEDDVEGIIFFDNLVSESSYEFFPDAGRPNQLPQEFLMWVYDVTDPSLKRYYKISVEMSYDSYDTDIVNIMCSINWKRPPFVYLYDKDNPFPENLLKIKCQRHKDKIYMKIRNRIFTILDNDQVKRDRFYSISS